MKGAKPIEEWVKEWFPLEFDHVLISYLPNRDMNRKPIPVKPWETRVLKLQGRLFGGATSYPARGSYRRQESGEIILEGTKLVTSFVMDKDLTEQALREVTGLLKEFGKRTGQEAVAFLLDGRMHYIPI